MNPLLRLTQGMNAFMQGANPQNEVNEEIAFQLEKFNKRVDELIATLRDRGEGAEEDLLALLNDFAAIDPTEGANFLIPELIQSYRELQEVQKQCNQQFDEQDKTIQMLTESQSAFQAQLEQLTQKLANTPTKHSLEPVVVELGKRVCTYIMNPASRGGANGPRSRFPQPHKF